jgi:molybdenum cofactor biosynthesis enzyme MoaA
MHELGKWMLIAGYNMVTRYRYFCTDCNEERARLTEDGRCTMCHGGRVIDHGATNSTEDQ